MFADTATIEVQAGQGGDGRLSFRHEKYRDRGGPDGGDGGRGGNIIFTVDHNLDTLSAYRTQRLIKAEAGQPGGGNRRHGRSGEDSIIKVPVGTIVVDEVTGDILADFLAEGQEEVIARGGRGGFGNAHFAASTRQAPRLAEPGGAGERRTVRLELKLVADIGLVGLPNAGKSTLLSVISNARPQIADYPFTTLVPNLGVVDFEGTSFLVADIPGLIEGASQGKGLGDEFLRHIERTAVLLHLIDAGAESVVADFRQVDAELRAFGQGLPDKSQIVVLTKIDGLSARSVTAQRQKLAKATGHPVLAISSVAHQGLDELLRAVRPLVDEARTNRQAVEAAALPIIDLASFPDAWRVEEDGDGRWRVRGERIESFARRTNPNQPDGVERLRDILGKMGVAKELGRRGVQAGDIVAVSAIELEW